MNKSQLLETELAILQSEIARYDGNGLSIKEWSIGVWSGLVAYGFSVSKAPIILAAVVTTLAFAFVEFTYRRFQSRFIARSKELELFLQEGGLDQKDGDKMYSYKIHRTAVKDDGFLKEGRVACKMEQFAVFYLMLVILAALAACYVGASKVED